jgi:putative DNA methylase
MVDHNFQPRGLKSEFGWHSRGCLPHFDAGEICQFVTLRLYDSVPQNILDKWRNEGITDVDFRKRIENYLDSGYGECWLKEMKIASLVQDTLWHHDGKRYRLIAWVVMPNHVHLLLRPLENEHLSEILHSIKSYSAQESNKLLSRKGQFWQRESFDRYIRNVDHFC